MPDEKLTPGRSSRNMEASIYVHATEPNRTVGIDYFAQSEEDQFKAIYYDALDNAIEGIKARFEQSDWLVFKNIQEVFLSSFRETNLVSS